jgi:Excreted virulence factor EspC, type VII ESX diderm
MIDPEIDYQHIVSGDAAALQSAADTLVDLGRDLDDARSRIFDAAASTDWSGPAAVGFQGRITRLAHGVNVNRSAVARARDALDVSGAAYDIAVSNADFYISFWRNRPSDLIPIFEQMLAMVVRVRLVEVAANYSQQLTGIAGVLTGQDVDLDALDEETRAWVEQGLEKNKEWAKESGSTFGPMIPNTAALGDDRGLTPQGLGYDPRTGTYVMSYYPDEDHHGPATLALVDSVTGREIGDVDLAGIRDPATERTGKGPSHAGGVSVQGDDVIVVDKGRVYTYSMSDIRAKRSGHAVGAISVQSVPAGGSYSAVRDGNLYLGDYKANTLHVYEKDRTGSWVPVRDASGRAEVHETPDKTQGVVVRDGEFVFSASPNRFKEGTLVSQDRTTGERSDPYSLPNMSEGVVEVDGQLVTTYESTALQYDDDGSPVGWIPMVPDDDNLWANPYLTMTPLSALGLSGDFEVQPGTLREASHALDGPSGQLATASSAVAGVRVRAHAFGEVPGAAKLASALTALLEAASDSLRSGSKAVALASDNLMDAARDYQRVETAVARTFGPQP